MFFSAFFNFGSEIMAPRVDTWTVPCELGREAGHMMGRHLNILVFGLTELKINSYELKFEAYVHSKVCKHYNI